LLITITKQYCKHAQSFIQLDADYGTERKAYGDFTVQALILSDEQDYAIDGGGSMRVLRGGDGIYERVGVVGDGGKGCWRLEYSLGLGSDIQHTLNPWHYQYVFHLAPSARAQSNRVSFLLLNYMAIPMLSKVEAPQNPIP